MRKIEINVRLAPFSIDLILIFSIEHVYSVHQLFSVVNLSS